MEGKERMEHDGQALYLAADQKIDKLKDQVSELFQKANSEKERIDHLFNRLDFGVAKTGQENSAKITDLAVKLNDLEHQLSAVDITSKQLEKVLGRIMSGIFWVCFTGILGGLIAMAYQIIRVKLVGG